MLIVFCFVYIYNNKKKIAMSFSDRQSPSFQNFLSGRSGLLGSPRDTSYKAFNSDATLQQRVIKMSPYYQGVLSQLYRGKTPAQLSRLSADTLPFFAKELDSMFKNVKTTRAATDAVADFIKLNRESIEILVSDYEQFNRDDLLSEYSGGGLNGKPVLRSRFLQPGQDTAKESVMQSVSDIVQSDLFSYRTTNPETGLNNSVYLDNLRNEYINTREPGRPRPPHELEQLVLPFPVLDQYKDAQPIEAIMMRDAQTTVAAEVLNSGPPRSFALNDASVEIDPFQLSNTQVTFMVNVNSLQPGFQRDFTQSTEFGENEYLGMTRTSSSLRFPREPEDDKYMNPIEKSVNLDREERGVGFDTLY
jgi:hypothetical protein